MSQIKIRTEVSVYPNQGPSVDRIMQKLVNSNFKEVLEDSSPYEFPIDTDEREASQDIFDTLISYIFNDENSPFWGKKTEDEIRQYVLNDGVTPEILVNWIKNVLLTSNPSSSVKKIFTLDPKIKKMIEMGEKYLNKYGKGLNENEFDSIKENKYERTLVVRSKYGEYPLKAYCISGGSLTSNDKRISHIKSLYRYETGCNYLEARPVLYTTWIDLPDEMKYQTYEKY